MKKILSIVAVILIMGMAACGSSSSYNPKVCEELKEKTEQKQTLSEGDINTMIDQVMAIAKTLKKEQDKFKDDPEKLKELKNDKEFQEMAIYAVGFVFYLSMHEKDLTPGNVKHLQEAQKYIDSIK